MPFAELLGQNKAITYLKGLAKSGQVPGAMLFFGDEGIGKAKAALEFAKALNCLDPQARAQGDSCGVCQSCRAIDQGTHPDVTFADFLYQARLEVKKDFSSKGYEDELEKELAKQQHINVDTIRDVTAKSQQKASAGGWKVLILDAAQTMQAAAANALLKFIEEPPYKTLWILITSKRSVMLKTILSRCQPLAFSPLAPADVKEILTQTGFDGDNLDLAARYSGGSVSRAKRAAEALALMAGVAQGPEWPCGVAAGLSRTLAVGRTQAQSVLDVIIAALHNQWTRETDPQKAFLMRKDLKKFEDYKRAITRNVSPALVLETALMNLDGLNIQIF